MFVWVRIFRTLAAVHYEIVTTKSRDAPEKGEWHEVIFLFEESEEGVISERADRMVFAIMGLEYNPELAAQRVLPSGSDASGIEPDDIVI